MATESAPTVPITPRNGIPVTLRASSAMRTVEPAKTTALPGGADREADRLVHAVAFLELAAVAMDDEQRIVDADRQTEHDPEDRRDRHHVDDARHRQRGEDADADADESAQDREPGAGEGAEHEDKDDGRDEESDQLTDADDARDAGCDLRGEVDRDARDGFVGEGVLNGLLGRRGDVELGGLEHDGSHSGAAVVGHEADAGGHVEKPGRLVELGALRVELRLAGVDLGLLGGKTRRGLVERAGGLGLRLGRVELSLTLCELSGRAVELCPTGRNLLLLGGAVSLRRERVDDPDDTVDLRRRGDAGADGGLFGLAQRAAIDRVKDDGAVSTGCRGKLGSESLGDLCGGRARDGQPGRHVARPRR